MRGEFLDSEGQLLRDDQQVRVEAGRIQAEIVKDTLPQDGIWRDLSVVVNLERDGATLFETRLHWETQFSGSRDEP